MTLKRWFFALFVLFILLCGAMIWGDSQDNAPEREPERLSREIEPNKLKRVPLEAALQSQPATGATSEPANASVESKSPSDKRDTAKAQSQAFGCLELSGVPATQLSRVQTQVNRIVDSQRTVTRVQEVSNDSWLVILSPAPTKAEAQRRMESLRAAGVQEMFLIQEQGPNYLAISLGLFRNEDAARGLSRDVRKMGFPEVTVVPRSNGAPRTASIQIRSVDEGEARRLIQLRRDYPGVQLKECPRGGKVS